MRYDWSSYPALSHKKKKARENPSKPEDCLSTYEICLCVPQSLRCVYIGPHGGEDVSRIFVFVSEITHCTSAKRLSEVTLFHIKKSNDAGTQEISMCREERTLH